MVVILQMKRLLLLWDWSIMVLNMIQNNNPPVILHLIQKPVILYLIQKPVILHLILRKIFFHDFCDATFQSHSIAIDSHRPMKQENISLLKQITIYMAPYLLFPFFSFSNTTSFHMHCVPSKNSVILFMRQCCSWILQLLLYYNVILSTFNSTVFTSNCF